MGSSCPLQRAQPFGAKMKLMIRISPMNASDISVLPIETSGGGGGQGNVTPQVPDCTVPPATVAAVAGVVLVFTPGGAVTGLEPRKLAIWVALPAAPVYPTSFVVVPVKG